MKNFKLLIIIFFLISNTGLAFEYSNYKPEEIDGICKNYSDYTKSTFKEEDFKDGMMFVAGGKNYKTKLKFLGKIRKVSSEHQYSLVFFEKTYSKKVTEMSTKEILVSSPVGVKYWMPIQDILIPYLTKEIRQNQLFYAYITSLQYRIEPTSFKCEGIYIINEFQNITSEDIKNEKIQKFYNEGQDLIKNKNLDKAEIFFNKILKLNPNHDDSLSNLCLIYELRNNYEKALKCYDQVIALDADAYESFYSKGTIFHNQKKYQEAINQFNKTIEIMEKNKFPSPDIARIYYARGLSKFILESEDSIVDFEKANKLNPQTISLEEIKNAKSKLDK